MKKTLLFVFISLLFILIHSATDKRSIENTSFNNTEISNKSISVKGFVVYDQYFYDWQHASNKHELNVHLTIKTRNRSFRIIFVRLNEFSLSKNGDIFKGTFSTKLIPKKILTVTAGIKVAGTKRSRPKIVTIALLKNPNFLEKYISPKSGMPLNLSGMKHLKFQWIWTRENFFTRNEINRFYNHNWIQIFSTDIGQNNFQVPANLFNNNSQYTIYTFHIHSDIFENTRYATLDSDVRLRSTLTTDFTTQ